MKITTEILHALQARADDCINIAESIYSLNSQAKTQLLITGKEIFQLKRKYFHRYNFSDHTNCFAIEIRESIIHEITILELGFIAFRKMLVDLIKMLTGELGGRLDRLRLNIKNICDNKENANFTDHLKTLERIQKNIDTICQQIINPKSKISAYFLSASDVSTK
jgi:hypothetical protein